nr:maleylpyruvate isomerase N-terminal domain-containing protein [Micromonospora sp. DSM 115978]
MAEWDAQVPGCPGWAVEDLVGHLGTIHRWAATIVRTGKVAEEPPAPSGTPSELLAWFDEGRAELVATLLGVDSDRECWTFGPRPRTAGFWIRRQAHETAVHRWDLESVINRSDGPAVVSATD